jgi:hypothetical protein
MNANWTAIQATRASPAPKTMSAPSDACRVHKVSLSGPFTRRKGRKAPLSAGPMALPVPAAPEHPQGQIPPSRQSSTSTSAVGAAEEPTRR